MSDNWTVRFLRYPWMYVINQIMGLILLNEWFTLYSNRFFTVTGFINRVSDIHAKSTFNIFNNLFLWLAQHFHFLPSLIALLLLTTACLMVLNIFRSIVNWVAVVIFSIYVLSLSFMLLNTMSKRPAAICKFQVAGKLTLQKTSKRL